MFKIFNGSVRGFGENPQQGIYAEISVDFRKHLRYFKGPKLAIFMAITLHADAKGWSTPSLKMLETETGYDGATISRTLTELCKMEIDGKRILLAIQERTKGKFVKNRYLIFPSLDEIAKHEGVARKPRRTAKTAHDTEPQIPNTVPPNTVSAVDGIDPVLEKPSLENNTSNALPADAGTRAPEPAQPIEPETKRESVEPEQPTIVKETALGNQTPPPTPSPRSAPSNKSLEGKAQPKAPNPWSALTTAMYEAIPDPIRPPRCHYAANNNAAKTLWEAGFTPERIAAYVKDMYQSDNWFKFGGTGGTPIVINMSMIEKRIKAWEAKKPSAISNGRYQPDDYGYKIDPLLDGD